MTVLTWTRGRVFQRRERCSTTKSRSGLTVGIWVLGWWRDPEV